MVGYKKMLAGVLTTTMVFGSSVVAFADEGSLSGTGGLEGSVTTDVFSVVLPTVADGATTFNYILDPEGLIAKTGGDRYTGKTFEADATLFFENTAADAAKNYSSTSDRLVVTNKSSEEVTVSVKATVSNIAGITMTSDKTFKDDTDASLYLALKDKTAENAITADTGAILSAPIAKAADDAYETKWNSTENKYEYVLTDEAKKTDYTGFTSYEFQLTGACNKAGDWSGLTETAPAVDVVWSVANPFGPEVALSEDGLISMTGLTAAKNFKSVSLTYEGQVYEMSSKNGTWDTSKWDQEDGGTVKFQLGSWWMDNATGKQLIVTLNLSDGTSKTTTGILK